MADSQPPAKLPPAGTGNNSPMSETPKFTVDSDSLPHIHSLPSTSTSRAPTAIENLTRLVQQARGKLPKLPVKPSSEPDLKANQLFKTPAPKPLPLAKPPTFCACPEPWKFTELREEILEFQVRSCAICHRRFRNVIYIEKPRTAVNVLLSWRGLLVLVLHLLQYSVFFYAAFIAFVDVSVARRFGLLPLSSHLLCALSIVFVLITVLTMARSIYSTAQGLCDHYSDMMITDVLLDLHPQ